MKYLLDTNICIHMIRKKPPKLLQKLTSFAVGDIAISSIVVAELQHGVQKSVNPTQNQQALNHFLLPFVFLSFGQVDAIVYGTIRVDLERRGLLIGPLDLLIAAQAIQHNLILVTNNTKEFSRLAQLQLEDWI